MRTFIAIELPNNIKEALTALQEKLEISQADVKWVEKNNIHLTLKFLGEIEETKLSQVMAALGEIASGLRSYSATISAAGGFPKIDIPRIIWVGISQGDSETKNMAKLIEENLGIIGIPKDQRAFTSHITLGRVRSGKNQKQLGLELNKLQKNFKALESFKVGKITLFKSSLSPLGPAYQAIAEVSLQNT